MTVLFLAVLATQGGWRPTVDNPTHFPSDLPRAARPAVLARIDPILPILKAALTTDGVEFQADRSFEGSPWVPGWPWPRSLSLFGFEADRRGGFEGEAATIITVFVNDLSPLLLPVLDDPPAVYVVRDQPGVVTLTRDDRLPWRPISQIEFARRMQVHLTRRARWDAVARSALQRLEADQPSARDVPMLLPQGYAEASYWPGFQRGIRAAVVLDSTYFDTRDRGGLQLLVLLGRVNQPRVHVAAYRRLRAFWRRLDRAALRALMH